jgi:hypothetical protein
LSVELRALPPAPLENETVVKQRDTQNHLPESLMEMLPGIASGMRIGKLVEPVPKLLHKHLVSGTPWVISGVQIPKILTRSIQEELLCR